MAPQPVFSVDMPHCHKQSGPYAGSALTQDLSYTDMMFLWIGKKLQNYTPERGNSETRSW